MSKDGTIGGRFRDVIIITQTEEEADAINENSNGKILAKPFGHFIINVRAKYVVFAYDGDLIRSKYDNELVDEYESYARAVKREV